MNNKYMEHVEQLAVYYQDRQVGTLALYKNTLAAFAYEPSWIADGFSISPFSLPLENRVFLPKMIPFDGLFGVFADSLPDGWGRLLVDRMLLKNHIDPASLNCLDRLAIAGDTAMGALTYRPKKFFQNKKVNLTLDELSEECAKVLNEKPADSLDSLFVLGGSSGGARPKILTEVDGENWLIKFPSTYDPADIGLQEYRYTLCAGKCGITVPKVKLFPSERCAGYFGSKRFDRNGQDRIHMLSVSALLEVSHRIPNLDYDSLMRLTLQLTGDMQEVEKMYRLMCFNVFAHNRDDHSRNFTYLYLPEESRWILSPAYDLTYSSSLGGEHATMIHGNGSDPGMNDILAVAKGIGITSSRAKKIAEEVHECVNKNLKAYLEK